ncbi:hypothetical protein QFC22_000196 [Naganishia vaughanmartiniae]|uniref:Uncharacterized protein n=1 Tax=Naganishia vaughanmartiniae TaxID=1424756 RepID=A0ACC2XNN7_9TREE|nr:hypothetical protein QFC22_000196 [Naganishia vaughanmartiniae]
MSYSKASSFNRTARARMRSVPIPTTIAAVALTTYIYHIQTSSPVSNDAGPSEATVPLVNEGLEILPKVSGKPKVNATTAESIAAAEDQAVWVWGSNRNNTLLPPASGSASTPNQLKTARPTPYVPKATPLRDLVLAEKYGAAVDGRGDLWFWGNGYWDNGIRNASPPGQSQTAEGNSPADAAKAQKSLKGKNITSVAATTNKIYALSSAGDIYAVAAARNLQKFEKQGGSSGSSSSSWWDTLGLGKLVGVFSQDPGVDFVKLDVAGDGGLKKGERFTSLVAGKSHILALTSKGQAFSMPVDPNGNSHKQLGTRITLPQLTTEQGASASSAVNPSLSASQAVMSALPASHDIRYCTALQPITSLSSIELAQVAAGENTSFFRTRGEGRVLGLGANSLGQIGLGALSNVEIVPVPTEIVLARSYPGGTTLKCLNIAAGANSTYFTVERSATAQPHMKFVDLLAVGSGLTGTLGNGLWSSANSTPVKVKTVSGLQEYSEASQSFVPLNIAKVSVSSSPTPHVFATLHTVALSDATGVQEKMYGNDCMAWGAGADYQTGTGKRSNLAVPQHLPPLKSPAKGLIDALGNGDSAPVAREKTLGSGTVSPMPHSRLQLHAGSADTYDLDGNLIKRNVKAEQTIYAGHNASAVYWKIVQD